MSINYPTHREPSRSTESWTVDRENMLRDLWADGLPASQIAAKLGGVSRSSVIGKVHRLGLTGRKLANRATAARERRKPTHHARPYKPSRSGVAAGGAFNTTFAHKAKSAPALELEEEPIELLDIPFAQRKTLIELSEHTCRWPVGHPDLPDFFFCGGDVAGEQVYCAYHCRVAYVPIDRRRQQKNSRWLERFA